MIHVFMNIVLVFIANVSVFSDIVKNTLILHNKGIKSLGGNENEKINTNDH
jgi:hypothetical protein